MNAVKIHQHLTDSMVIGGGAGVSTGATVFGIAMRDVNEYLQGASYLVAIASGSLAAIYTVVKIYEHFNTKRKARRR